MRVQEGNKRVYDYLCRKRNTLYLSPVGAESQWLKRCFNSRHRNFGRKLITRFSSLLAYCQFEFKSLKKKHTASSKSLTKDCGCAAQG